MSSDLYVKLAVWCSAVWPLPGTKVKVTEVRKLRKYPISKSCLLHRYACNQKNYDTPRQYINFNRMGFWYSPSFIVTWPSNSGCSTFGKRILPLMRSRPTVPCLAYLFVFMFIWFYQSDVMRKCGICCVRHNPALCLNGWTYCRKSLTTW